MSPIVTPKGNGNDQRARRVWDALREAVMALDAGAQMELGGALADGATWEDVPEWIRESMRTLVRGLQGAPR